MDDMMISIRIEEGRTEFRPGEVIEGQVNIRAGAPWTAQYAQVLLAWRTEGKGDEDSATAAGMNLYEPGASIPPNDEKNFRFTVPAMPWTYRGNFLKIHWTIVAIVDPKPGKEIVESIDIIVHPHPEIFHHRTAQSG